MAFSKRREWFVNVKKAGPQSIFTLLNDDDGSQIPWLFTSRKAAAKYCWNGMKTIRVVLDFEKGAAE